MFTVKLLIVSSHVGCAHQNVKFSFGDFILITGLVWIWLIVGEYTPQQINSNESSFTSIWGIEAVQKLLYSTKKWRFCFVIMWVWAEESWARLVPISSVRRKLMTKLHFWSVNMLGQKVDNSQWYTMASLGN